MRWKGSARADLTRTGDTACGIDPTASNTVNDVVNVTRPVPLTGLA